tara:strand:+ start:9031 stop:9948 length:918 start_codon:yes stop_codon:yes gene_type:complete
MQLSLLFVLVLLCEPAFSCNKNIDRLSAKKEPTARLLCKSLELWEERYKKIRTTASAFDKANLLVRASLAAYELAELTEGDVAGSDHRWLTRGITEQEKLFRATTDLFWSDSNVDSIRIYLAKDASLKGGALVDIRINDSGKPVIVTKEILIERQSENGLLELKFDNSQLLATWRSPTGSQLSQVFEIPRRNDKAYGARQLRELEALINCGKKEACPRLAQLIESRNRPKVSDKTVPCESVVTKSSAVHAHPDFKTAIPADVVALSSGEAVNSLFMYDKRWVLVEYRDKRVGFVNNYNADLRCVD